MLATLIVSAAEVVNRFRLRDFTLSIVGGKLSVSPASKLSRDDRLLIRQRKPELLRVLGNDVDAAPEVTRHQATISIECFSTTVESWDERGIANLVAVARQAGFCLEYDSTGLTIEGPSTPTELRRLLREQAAGIARLLETA